MPVKINKSKNVKKRLLSRYENNLESAGKFIVQKQKEAVLNGTGRPGDAPNSETGNLANSHDYRIVNNDLQLFNTAEYALRLEKGFTGTDTLGRVYFQLPRPWFLKTITSNREQIQKILNKKNSINR